ncbi:MAG: thiamine pyrophosphate-dependent dehydrogenase E1 component subunit alpha [Polaromonas sp.]|uniref:thiamine pyrophosphate-dependent dehydrogenase E1 component subunit alpha n=1 Tax=Polaromonas sp. TaxID=1869339 RepID=UPI00271EE2A3|nr:thiamine pyrophosphate-dependent dehydrogenase E1 component subunit alpha [Polaromonas sp.]MDO9116117.1 thiamine pyrophosphate-dependent dehydrogenase E1 component subunit alpha [Polaromonas sp.]
MSADKNTRLAIYRTMVTIRQFETMAGEYFAAGQIPGFIHLSIGQEGSSTGVCSCLRPDDYVATTHRGHGHMIAKGADLKRMVAELFGKVTGYCKGKGGSMHIADFSVGMLGANGVVAAGLPIAVGAAHAQKLQKRDAITVCFFGDGAINRGPFLEALNWAQVYSLPVLFVCEDNRWSATTASGPMTAGAGASVRAESFDIPAVKVDGNDVLAVFAAAATLVQQVRSGIGPRLLHAITYRVKGHVSVDPAAYRHPDELNEALKTDPIARARAAYLQAGGDSGVLAAIETQATDEVAAAVAGADAAPWPDAAAAFTDIQTTGAGTWH